MVDSSRPRATPRGRWRRAKTSRIRPTRTEASPIRNFTCRYTKSLLAIECVVCCELYDTSVHAPMVLPCSGAHEICRTCVAALRKADGTIQCPKCREDATGAVNPNRGLIAALRLSRRS